MKTGERLGGRLTISRGMGVILKMIERNVTEIMPI
jgi:hypothetical protein